MHQGGMTGEKLTKNLKCLKKKIKLQREAAAIATINLDKKQKQRCGNDTLTKNQEWVNMRV